MEYFERLTDTAYQCIKCGKTIQKKQMMSHLKMHRGEIEGKKQTFLLEETKKVI